MLKTIQKLHKTINERSIELCVDHDTPLNDVKDALFEFVKYVCQMEAMLAIQQASAQPKPEEKKEEVNGVESSV